MEAGGVPLSHLLSRKEKVSGAARGHGRISVDSASLRQRGRLTGASGGHCQPHPAADSQAQRNACSVHTDGLLLLPDVRACGWLSWLIV